MKKLDVETLKKHKKKLIVAGIGVAVLTSAGFGGNYYVQAKETEKEIQQKEAKKKEVAKQEAEKNKMN